MTNMQIMKKALEALVIKDLVDKGFVGKWPHFRRENEGCMELISFQINKWGGAFTVELSAVFPLSERKNYVPWEGLTLDQVTVWNTMERYRLKGMYDGWFYYRDLYCKRIPFSGMDYIDVPENKADSFRIPEGYRLVQKFAEDRAREICVEVHKQLQEGFRWLENFVRVSTQPKARFSLFSKIRSKRK